MLAGKSCVLIDYPRARGWILCSDWLSERERWAHLACSRSPALITDGNIKGKKNSERTYKVHTFWTMSAIESQKAAGDNQNIKTQLKPGCYKNSWLSFSSLEISRCGFVIMRLSFCLFVTELLQSRWLDISLVLFFSVDMDLNFVQKKKKTQKKNSAKIQPSWPHAWSITHYVRSFWSWYFRR